MKQLLTTQWYYEVNKILETITVKADDGASTPICRIATPMGNEWMKNSLWLNNALKKAEVITYMPKLYRSAKKLIEQIEMNEYVHIGESGDVHKLKDNKDLIHLKKIIEYLS